MKTNIGIQCWIPEIIKPKFGEPVLLDLGDKVFSIGAYDTDPDDSDYQCWVWFDAFQIYSEQLEPEMVKGWCYILPQKIFQEDNLNA